MVYPRPQPPSGGAYLCPSRESPLSSLVSVTTDRSMRTWRSKSCGVMTVSSRNDPSVRSPLRRFDSLKWWRSRGVVDEFGICGKTTTGALSAPASKYATGSVDQGWAALALTPCMKDNALTHDPCDGICKRCTTPHKIRLIMMTSRNKRDTQMIGLHDLCPDTRRCL